MKLYLHYLSIQVRSEMQHKASFVLLMFGQLLTSFAAFLEVYFLFHRFHTLAGFTWSEILLCHAAILMAFSIAETFFRGFDHFPRLISDGRFDRMLVRPRGTMFQVLATKIELGRLGRFVQAAAVFAYAIPASGVDWTPSRILCLAAMVVGAALVFAGLFIVYAFFTFFTTEGLEFMNIFTDGGREFGSYPFVIYGDGVLRFLTFVIPLAAAQYYPLMFILGRADAWWYGLTPVAAALFLVPAYGLWRLGVLKYRSTGS